MSKTSRSTPSQLSSANVVMSPPIEPDPSDKRRIATRRIDPGFASSIMCATHQGWFIVESKNDPKLKDVDAIRELLSEAKDYFPQYASLPLYPIFAALSIPDHVIQYCTRHRIYALGLGPETMQLLNFAQMASPASLGS